MWFFTREAHMSYYYPWFWMNPYYTWSAYPNYGWNMTPMMIQAPHQSWGYPQYFTQPQQGPGLGADLAGILGFGALRWYALRSLFGY